MSGLIGPSSRVLVRLPSWLGDLLACEPLVRRLDELIHVQGVRDSFGRGRLTLAASARLLGAFEGRFELAQRAPIDAALGESAASWREHDVVMLLNGSWRSAWTAWRAGIPERVGFADGARGALLTRGVRSARERGRIPLSIGRAGGGRRALPRPFAATVAELSASVGAVVADRAPRLEITPRWAALAQQRLAAFGLRDEPFVLVNAGARPNSAKGCPPASWARLLDELAAHGAPRFVVACAPGEEAAAHELVGLVRRAQVHLCVEPAPSIGELAALSAGALLVLATDNGARHVAQAVRARAIVVLHGPTDRRHTAEHAPSVRALAARVPCGPCHLERCSNPESTRHVCWRELDLARIVHTVMTALPPRAPSP